MPRLFALSLLAVLCILASACLGGGEAKEESIPLPELNEFDAGLSLRLAGIATTAAEVRGLELNEDITQGSLTKKQYAEYYDKVSLEAAIKYGNDYDTLDTTYRLLHMIAPDESLTDTTGEDAADWILGFYTSEGENLVLISDQPEELTLSNEATLAHEYVHSFQDKAFGLTDMFERGDKEIEDKANTEYSDTMRALIEGDASVAELEYVRKKVGDKGLRDWLSANEEVVEELTEKDEDTGPEALGRYGAFPYTYGSGFVRYLFDEGGWDLVNEAYENPPKTEEQILHPEKYLRGEEGQDISLRDVSKDLGEGWQQDLDAVFGEFDVANWLVSTLDNDFQATSAAAGWGGGRLAVYTNELDEDAALLHMAILWDSRQQAREFYITFGDVLKKIDPDPMALDGSYQLVRWGTDNEAGQAWIDGTTFQMVVTPKAADLDTALDAISAPETISPAGFILAEQTSGQDDAPPPIGRLRDILIQPGDLPPDYVALSFSDSNIGGAFAGSNIESASTFYSDVRSIDDGLYVSADLYQAAVGAGVIWSDLRDVPRRQLFNGLLSSIAGDGKVTSFSAMSGGNVGAVAVGARAVIQQNDGPNQRVELIAYGRGATLIVIATVESVNSHDLNINRYARIMDERLKRYSP